MDLPFPEHKQKFLGKNNKIFLLLCKDSNLKNIDCGIVQFKIIFILKHVLKINYNDNFTKKENNPTKIGR